jgi:hypothetical protein
VEVVRETKTDPNNCWFCNAEITAASDVQGDKKPVAGNISFCVMCAAPGIFLDDLTTRRPTLAEMTEILKSEDCLKHMYAINMVHQTEGKPGA